MKKMLLSIAAVAVLAVVTGCDVHFTGNWSDASLKAVTNVVQTAAMPAGLKYLSVDNRFGTVHIVGSDSGTNSWTWKLKIRARTEAVAQQIANGAKCKVELAGDRLNLVVSLPKTRKHHSVESDFEISVPKSVAVRAQNHFGATDISDLAADVEATDQNGRVDIRNIAGNVRAETSFDALSVSKTGPAILKNQNGSISATGIDGRLEATTSFDALFARDVHGAASLANQNGKIKAEAISGFLDAHTSFDSLAAHDIGSAAKLHNQNGAIEAVNISGRLDAGTSFDSLVARDIGGPVHLRNQNGSIKVEGAKGDADVETSFDRLEVAGIQGDAILANQNGGISASEITGAVKASTSFDAMDVKGGGPKFICHNQNGAIRLRATSTALAQIEATTSFDRLEVRLPAGLKPAIEAHTTLADIKSDFPVFLKPRGDEAFAGIPTGTARISLQNQNGDIHVLKE